MDIFETAIHRNAYLSYALQETDTEFHDPNFGRTSTFNTEQANFHRCETLPTGSRWVPHSLPEEAPLVSTPTVKPSPRPVVKSSPRPTKLPEIVAAPVANYCPLFELIGSHCLVQVDRHLIKCSICEGTFMLNETTQKIEQVKFALNPYLR